MNVSLRRISGPWDAGWVLDKHTLSSVFLGYNEYGHAVFDTTRSAVGEATYQLKYRSQWDQVTPLAAALAEHIYPRFQKVGFIVPMPASTTRPRQPVTEIANELGRLVNVPVFNGLLLKEQTGQPLKNLHTKEDKLAALASRIHVQDEITNQGRWNVLVVDDLYDSGASMEAACQVLRSYAKVRNIYVAALTWK